MQKRLYHGTLMSFKNSILSNGFSESDRKDNYLGTGVYFYDDRKLSYEWARKKAKHYSDGIVVFKCDVAYTKVLDLTQKRYYNAFSNFASELDSNYAIKRTKNLYGRKLAAMKATYYMNLYCEKYNYEIIKAEVDCTPRNELREMGLITKTEVQYCVRNLSSISNINVVYEKKESRDYEAY